MTNDYKETVRDIFDICKLNGGQHAKIITSIIEHRHADYFCEPKKQAEGYQYNILTAHSSHDLVNAVDEAIKDGWKPMGGVSMVANNQDRANSTNGFYYFAQAIIKEAKK